jgi:hypothetical protein
MNDFKDLVLIDPLMYDETTDPLGLMVYYNHKRKRAVLGERTLSKVEFFKMIKEYVAEDKVERVSFSSINESPGHKSLRVDITDSYWVYADINEADLTVTFPVSLITEVLTLQQRMKRKIIMRRIAPRLARARKMAMRRRGGTDVLKRRAKALARKTMAKKLLGGRNKANVSPSEKARVEKMLIKRKSAIERLAVKFLPIVRKKQADRFNKKKTPAKKAPVKKVEPTKTPVSNSPNK